MSGIRLLLTVALVAILAHVASSTLCAGMPYSLSIGTSCAGEGRCRKGSYCSYMGVCTAVIAANGNCSNPFDTCAFGYSCLGVVPNKMCVADVGPGSVCSTNTSQSLVPMCAPSFFCTSQSGNPPTGKCGNARLGDSCTATADCANSVPCVSGVCAYLPDNSPCQGSSQGQCSPNSFCFLPTATSGNGTCVPLPTTSNCSSSIIGNSGQCAYGYYCLGMTPTDQYPQCYAPGALANGAYCGGSHAACKSGVCAHGYCATSVPPYCNSNSECGVNGLCLCDGNPILTVQNSVVGVGYCSTTSCQSQRNTFLNCTAISCGTSFSYPYVGSCVALNCMTQFTNFDNCDSATGLFVSFSMVTLFAVLVSLFSREF